MNTPEQRNAQRLNIITAKIMIYNVINQSEDPQLTHMGNEINKSIDKLMELVNKRI